MDQISIINQLIDCLNHKKVIRLLIGWLDGKSEYILFELYSIGYNLLNKWTFIYGQDTGRNKKVSIPVPFIISLEETDDCFTVAEKDKCLYVLDFEKNQFLKSIPEIQIIDISEPDDEDEEDEEDEVLSCPYCDDLTKCEHLVFEYDMSFNKFVAGKREEFYAVRKVIEDFFLDAITKSNDIDFNDVSGDIDERWDGYGEYFKDLWDSAYVTEDGSVYIDVDVFPRLIEHMYISFRTCYEMRKIAYPERAYAPGYDSAILGYYAEDPSALLRDTAINIKEYLEEVLKKNHSR